MQQNLVIVESPTKAKTIGKFLGEGYKVVSSLGHIRDLKKRGLSIDEARMKPEYEIPSDKKEIVSALKKDVKEAEKVWLASDEDREGEAISWHLCEVLGLDEQKAHRIVFHEITRQAIEEALQNPRHLDLNLVNAQQARRVLDRIVGFKLSPVLWRKVRPSLSAGRVQSVAVRLIVEREREIQAFNNDPYYRITAVFKPLEGGSKAPEIRAELDRRFTTRQDALAFLELCKGATFRVKDVSKKPAKRFPAPPFTTSTLQQEASRKLGFTVSQTMRVAQMLYENGQITYMRTDSVNLSKLALGASKATITELYGKEYSTPRNYHTRSKGAQEAHEAIRPTAMERQKIEGTAQERKLYDLIWKRTTASQMAEAETEKTTVSIEMQPEDNSAAETFTANGEVVKFDGFLKVYRESVDEEENGIGEETESLPALVQGEELKRVTVTSTERFPQGPSRYTEASLVKKLEELGIGRPSTYAPTISTIQQRQYVKKGENKGEERVCSVDTLAGDKLKSTTKKELAGSEKGKLLPTDTGMVVNDFLTENFPAILDYNFTAKVEGQFDLIAEGKKDWSEMLKEFDHEFEPRVKEVMEARSAHKAGERELGKDPRTGRTVYVKIGRFGPVAQLGAADEKVKPTFAQVPSGMSIETMTLDNALELFKLPRVIGSFEGEEITIGSGRFGPYIKHDGKYVSIPKNINPMSITLEEATSLIRKKRAEEAKKHLKTFDEDPTMEILNGRFGPYIAWNGSNFRIPKAMQDRASELTYDQCKELIAKAGEPKKKPSRQKKA